MSEHGTLRVDPANLDAYRAWDGADGAFWAEHEDHFDRAVARYDEAFLAAAAIEVTDRVLDIGCGTGHTTREAARRAARGSALGVDLSSQMIELARRRAAEQGVANASFLQADAQVHPFDPGASDVAISRTGAMFFGDPVAAFANIATALLPGGRLALLTWQPLPLNHWILEFSRALAAGREMPVPPPGAPGPFSLSDPDRVRAILTSAGFRDVGFDDVREPMWFGTDADDAYAFVRSQGFAEGMLQGLDEEQRAGALAALRASIEAHETGDGVVYPSAAWVVTARRA
jgi:SAM-dependent methyltransferase